MNYEVINGEALAEMSKLAERGIVVDACIADPPFGTTRCAWDAVIPLEPMWANLKRLVKGNGVIALFSGQPFTSALVASNFPMWRHEWVWIKNRGSNFANTVREPFKEHETVQVFSEGGWTYNAQRQERAESGLARVAHGVTMFTNSENYGAMKARRGMLPADRKPSSWQKFNTDTSGLHPTIKPVAWLRYLVRTYTNPGDTVLDFTAGSFTTGVACAIEGRNFIGIEQSADYCAIGEARLKRASGIPADIPRFNTKQIETPLFEGAR